MSLTTFTDFFLEMIQAFGDIFKNTFPQHRWLFWKPSKYFIVPAGCLNFDSCYQTLLCQQCWNSSIYFGRFHYSLEMLCEFDSEVEKKKKILEIDYDCVHGDNLTKNGAFSWIRHVSQSKFLQKWQYFDKEKWPRSASDQLPHVQQEILTQKLRNIGGSKLST